MSEKDSYFPEIIKRFLNEGLSSLTFSEQNEAMNYLMNLYETEPCDRRIVHILLQFLNQLGDYQKAKDVGYHFLTMNGYVKEILGELSVSYMQTDEMDTYFTLVKHFMENEPKDDSRAAAEEKPDNLVFFPRKYQPARDIQNFPEWSASEQLSFLQQISIGDFSRYLEPLKGYLMEEQISPYVKTVIFELFQEQQVDQELSVEKGAYVKTFNPAQLCFEKEQKHADEVILALHEKLESDNPSLLEQLLATFQHHLFLLYPFSYPENTAENWANAYIDWAMSFYQEEQPVDEQIEECVRFIEKIEKYQQKFLI
ncbi:hypothetical protein [Listeria costaricensis]|uniref:hypothetical protein n=1 Tax=Listeria costaricensis TaxID=2026604 RepID=UPI000C082722|nr:hypothetical protein [Listeria costaricensis]